MLLLLGGFFAIMSLAMAGFILREGKVNISRRYSVYGWPARIVGLLMFCWVPISVAVLGVMYYTNREFVAPGNRDLLPAAVLEVTLLVILGCLLVAGAIALIFVEDDYWTPGPLQFRDRTPKPRRRNGRELRQDEIEDEEEERARRKARRKVRREDDEAPPRKRRR